MTKSPVILIERLYVLGFSLPTPTHYSKNPVSLFFWSYAQRKLWVHLWPFIVLRYTERILLFLYQSMEWETFPFSQTFYDKPQNETMSWGLASFQNLYGKYSITSVWDFWKNSEEGGLYCLGSPLLFLFLTSFWGCFIQTNVEILPLIHQFSFFMSPPLRV